MFIGLFCSEAHGRNIWQSLDWQSGLETKQSRPEVRSSSLWSLRAAQYEVVPKKRRVLVLHGLTARSKHTQSSLQDKKAPISCAQTPM